MPVISNIQNFPKGVDSVAQNIGGRLLQRTNAGLSAYTTHSPLPWIFHAQNTIRPAITIKRKMMFYGRMNYGGPNEKREETIV